MNVEVLEKTAISRLKMARRYVEHYKANIMEDYIRQDTGGIDHHSEQLRDAINLVKHWESYIQKNYPETDLLRLS